MVRFAQQLVEHRAAGDAVDVEVAVDGHALRLADGARHARHGLVHLDEQERIREIVEGRIEEAVEIAPRGEATAREQREQAVGDGEGQRHLAAQALDGLGRRQVLRAPGAAGQETGDDVGVAHGIRRRQQLRGIGWRGQRQFGLHRHAPSRSAMMTFGKQPAGCEREAGRKPSPVTACAATTMYLGPALPPASSDLPGSQARRATSSSPIWSCTGWGLPCHFRHRKRGELLPHRFTLTSPRRGGLFSVALSVGSLLLGVTQHPALRCSDFPRTRRSS